MLIVNADDWGHSPAVTDAILACFDAGVVSSTTALVWMRDSLRCAEIARERRLPVGLHLNLTLPLEADGVPARVRERHRKVVERFSPDVWRDPTAAPVDATLVADVIRDQLDRFREAFGEPTHIDGHNHVHVHPTVLELLPTELPVRTVPRAPSALDDPRDERERMLHARFTAPDVALELEWLHPALGGSGLQPVVARAGAAVVEVVTHPLADREALDSPAWRELVGSLPLGSYRDLERRSTAAPRSASPPAPATTAPMRRPCPICGCTDRVDYHGRADAVCASCGSLERQRALGRILEAHVPRPSPRCLEVGPRNDRVFGGWLRARGWDYEAVDRWDLRGRADPDALGTFIHHDADLSDLHFARSASYDLVVLQHVLEEVLDYQSGLDEISRIVRCGGAAHLQIPWRPDQPTSAIKAPDRYGSVWAFGADLLDELRMRFSRVDVLRLTEDRYVGDSFACWQE